MNLGRADYERLTGLAEPFLGKGKVDRYRPEVERIAGEALDGRHGEFDLMADFARKAAVRTVGSLVGLPVHQQADFAALCSGLGVALDAGLCPPQLNTARLLVASVDKLKDMFTELIEARRAESRNDLISDLLRAAGQDAPATEDTLAIAMLMSVVGIEVAANLVCNAMALLFEHPGQWSSLCDDPSLAAGAIEETLRYAPPIRLENRIAREDFELEGEEIKADGQVVVLVEAANRDPEAYPDPDSFDIARKPAVESLSLSGGMYTGFLAPLVRLQATEALRTLASRLPDLRQKESVLRRMRSPVARGVLRFPVEAA